MVSSEEIAKFIQACMDKKQYELMQPNEKNFKCLPNCVSAVRFHNNKNKEGKRWLDD